MFQGLCKCTRTHAQHRIYMPLYALWRCRLGLGRIGTRQQIKLPRGSTRYPPESSRAWDGDRGGGERAGAR